MEDFHMRSSVRSDQDAASFSGDLGRTGIAFYGLYDFVRHIHEPYAGMQDHAPGV
jgi:hypothetical protein